MSVRQSRDLLLQPGEKARNLPVTLGQGRRGLLRAEVRRAQKAGRLCSRSDFGQYFGLVQEEGAA